MCASLIRCDLTFFILDYPPFRTNVDGPLVATLARAWAARIWQSSSHGLTTVTTRIRAEFQRARIPGAKRASEPQNARIPVTFPAHYPRIPPAFPLHW